MRAPSALRRLGALVWLDLRQAYHGRLLHVTLALGLLFGAAIRWALPAEATIGAAPRIADLTEDHRFAALLTEVGPDLARPSLAAIEADMSQETGTIGLAFRGDPRAPAATLVLQGHEGPATIAALKAGIAATWAARGGLEREVQATVTTLHPAARRPPFNLAWVPVVLTLDVLIVGFFFGGVMLLQEKALGTVQAYRVSPGGTAIYVASKVLVNVLLALVYTAILLALAPTPAIPIAALATVVALSSAALTLAGLALAVHFRGLSSFFYPAAALSLILSAAMPAYAFPALNSPWVRALPTYQALFTLRELLFPGGREGVVAGFVGEMAIYFVVFAGLAYWAIDRRLLRDAG